MNKYLSHESVLDYVNISFISAYSCCPAGNIINCINQYFSSKKVSLCFMTYFGRFYVSNFEFLMTPCVLKDPFWNTAMPYLVYCTIVIWGNTALLFILQTCHKYSVFLWKEFFVLLNRTLFNMLQLRLMTWSQQKSIFVSASMSSPCVQSCK